MVTTCSAFGCTNRYKKGNNIGFYRFPKDPNHRALWIIAVRRKNWTPSPTSRICGKHFQNGRPSYDQCHPDWVPNVFQFRKPKRSAAEYEKKMKILVEEIRLKREAQKKSTTAKYKSALSQKLATGSSQSELPQQQGAALNQEALERIKNLKPQVQYLQVENVSPFKTSTTAKNESKPSQESATGSSESELPKQQDPALIEALEKIKILQKQVHSLHVENNILKSESNELKDTLQQTMKEIDFLRAEKHDLKEKVTKLHPANSILNDPQRLSLYTGLKSHDLFYHIVKELRSDMNDTDSLSIEEQIIIVLMKLKLNLLTSDLAFRFNVSRRTILRIYNKWLPIISSRFNSFLPWPNSKAIRKHCPKPLKGSEFENAKCIIDCSEFLMQLPNPPLDQAQT